MSEKICPVGFSFITNRYSRSDLACKSQKMPTVILDSKMYDYGEVFERAHFEPERLYSWEANGKVKGLFEGKGDRFVSLTKTTDGGILEKVKKGASSLVARYTREGKLVDLVEVTPNKTTFMDMACRVTEATGMSAKTKLQNVIRGIKII